MWILISIKFSVRFILHLGWTKKKRNQKKYEEKFKSESIEFGHRVECVAKKNLKCFSIKRGNFHEWFESNCVKMQMGIFNQRQMSAASLE